jgi:class 3 adenylate cyclase
LNPPFVIIMKRQALLARSVRLGFAGSNRGLATTETDLLNGYFDAMSEPIARHGGKILKFIGDGLLAIFPLSQPSACANLDARGDGHRSISASSRNSS